MPIDYRERAFEAVKGVARFGELAPDGRHDDSLYW